MQYFPCDAIRSDSITTRRWRYSWVSSIVVTILVEEGAYVMSSSLSEVGGEGIGVATGVGFAESIGVAVGDATGGTLK